MSSARTAGTCGCSDGLPRSTMARDRPFFALLQGEKYHRRTSGGSGENSAASEYWPLRKGQLQLCQKASEGISRRESSRKILENGSIPAQVKSKAGAAKRHLYLTCKTSRRWHRDRRGNQPESNGDSSADTCILLIGNMNDLRSRSP